MRIYEKILDCLEDSAYVLSSSGERDSVYHASDPCDIPAPCAPPPDPPAPDPCNVPAPRPPPSPCGVVGKLERLV